jgi:hypothetical protein
MFIGDEDILSLFLSEMGVKEAFVGDTSIYRRDGGYFYIELELED